MQADIQPTEHDYPQQTVAVLIPFYHAERLDWLAEALESIATQQTRHNVRIYLGIDGPMRAELETFLYLHREKLYKVVHNTVNQGLAVMLNRMIDKLEDETFVLRLDADDLALPHRVETQVNWMLAHEDISVSGGSIIETDFKPNGYRQMISYPLTHETIVKNFHKRSPIAHPTCIFRKEVFNQGYRYPTEATYNEDLGLWLKMIISGVRFSNLPDALIKFRIQPDFYRKRGLIKAVIEFRLFWESIKPMGKNGFDMIFPILRFTFRLTPTWLKKLGYQSKIRRLL